MFNRIVILAAALGLTLGLAACGETQEQKEAKAFREFCAKGNNKVEVPECAQLSGGPN